MKGNLKKMLCAALSAAMTAGMVVLPTTASAEYGVTMSYSDGVLSINSDKEQTATVLSAKYSNGILIGATVGSVSLNEGVNEVSMGVEDGSKILLWNKLQGMIPIAEPITADFSTSYSMKYDFGSTDNVADGYTAVSADTKYTSELGYGFIGIENGFTEDPRTDGWTMTQGYDLELVNGKNDNVITAADDWVATTTRIEKEQNYISPIRFGVKVENNTYYKVKINLKRADEGKEARVNLFTEKRHQHLLNESIPVGGMTYETSVYVHNNWSKNTQNYEDKMLNIVAEGDNVAISAIEIQPTEQGKTFWILGDSTVCEQTASIPYFPLEHCQGVGSAMTKYIGTDWALVNEAESGLSASSAKNHFANMINDVKPGDVVWFEFGHNDDKVSNDPSTNGYLSTLSDFYNQITEKGANLIVASPIERDQERQFKGGKWTFTLSHYTTAASSFVEEKIKGGAKNIAFIDLNTASLNFLNCIQKEIDEGRKAAGLESLGSATTRFYYFVSKASSYKADYTHPNDYGADNFAKLAIEEAKKTIAAASAENATESQKIQAEVLSKIFLFTRGKSSNKVPEEIYKAGAPTNEYYPNELSKVTYYDFPWLITKVTFDNDGYFESVSGKSVACQDISSVYGRGIVKIYNSDGILKGTVSTLGGERAFFDSSIQGDQTIDFVKNSDTVKYDAESGDTYEVYITDIDQSGNDSEVIVSNKLTQDDNIDVKEYLLQGAMGTENKEDFSSYGLVVGDSIISKNGWTNPGGESFVYGEENGISYAHCVTTGSSTYYPEKNFTAVKDGQLYCKMDIRYKTGTFALHIGDGSKQLNDWGIGRITPVEIKNVGGEIKVYLAGKAVASINSGEWITLALTIDMDYATYSLSVNGNTYTADFNEYNTNNIMLSPSKLATIGFVNDRTSNEYDITNIVLATLNTEELQNKTLTVETEDENKGVVSIKNGDNIIEEKTLAVKMNTQISAIVQPKPGYIFAGWKDAEGNVVSYAETYEMRLHNDTSITATFEEEVIDPITYLYKEDFTKLTTSTLDWTKNGLNTIESDTTDGIGQYFKTVPNSDSGNRSAYKVLPSDAQTGGDLMLEFNLKMTRSASRPNQFAIVSKGTTENKNAFFTDKVVLSFTQVGSEEIGVNATAISDSVMTADNKTSGYKNDVWTKVTARLNFTDKTVAVKITSLDGNTTYMDTTVNMLGDVSELGAMQATTGRGKGAVGLDNIKIYTADQIAAE